MLQNIFPPRVLLASHRESKSADHQFRWKGEKWNTDSWKLSLPPSWMDVPHRFFLGDGDFDLASVFDADFDGEGFGGKISVSRSCPKISLAGPMLPEMEILSCVRPDVTKDSFTISARLSASCCQVFASPLPCLTTQLICSDASKMLMTSNKSGTTFWTSAASLNCTSKGPFSFGGASGMKSRGRTGTMRPLCLSTFTFPRASISRRRFMEFISETICAFSSWTFNSFKPPVAFCKCSFKAACAERLSLSGSTCLHSHSCYSLSHILQPTPQQSPENQSPQKNQHGRPPATDLHVWYCLHSPARPFPSSPPLHVALPFLEAF